MVSFGSVPEANVNDDMSFREAFAAARAEVGPGGIFSWHGNVYNTYVTEEWEAMSVEERSEFGDRVYGAHVAYTEQVEVLETEEAELTIDEIGIVETEDGEQMIVAVGSVGDEQIAFADVDCDGTVDVIMDSHGNEISGVEVTVDQLCDMAMANESYPEAQDLYAGAPDYMNDADTTAFA